MSRESETAEVQHLPGYETGFGHGTQQAVGFFHPLSSKESGASLACTRSMAAISYNIPLGVPLADKPTNPELSNCSRPVTPAS